MSNRDAGAKKEENGGGSGLLGKLMMAGQAVSLGYMVYNLWNTYQQSGPSTSASQDGGGGGPRPGGGGPRPGGGEPWPGGGGPRPGGGGPRPGGGEPWPGGGGPRPGGGGRRPGGGGPRPGGGEPWPIPDSDKNNMKAIQKTGQQAQDKDVPEALRCIICCDKPRKVITMPCQHAAMCFDCAVKVTRCPVCQLNIEEIKMVS